MAIGSLWDRGGLQVKYAMTMGELRAQTAHVPDDASVLLTFQDSNAFGLDAVYADREFRGRPPRGVTQNGFVTLSCGGPDPFAGEMEVDPSEIFEPP